MGHALLAPSAAYRWLNCTASPLLEATVEDVGSDFTREGTLAHAYAAKALKGYLGQPTTEEDEHIAELAPRYETGEMAEHVETYRAIVLGKLAEARVTTADAALRVEERVTFAPLLEGYGTADAIIIADGCIDVVDLKYGKGVRVDAPHNPQMMIYALGALLRFSDEYRIGRVRMTIVQPRLANVSDWEISAVDLMDWAHRELAPKATEAKAGGTAKPGDWCRFCKVRPRCKALAAMATEAAATAPNPALIDDETLATTILPVLDTIASWVTAAKEHALTRALAGAALPGYKLVAGRSIRRVSDTDGLTSTLREMGYSEADILRPRETKTITELERLVGKKRFAEACAGYITKPTGKPTLVPESDRREPYDPVKADFDGYNFED